MTSSDDDPIRLLFGGMTKLGPGTDADTRLVLGLLPRRPRRLVVDAGCGSGRQTLVLAEALNTLVHAVDTHQPFLDDLVRRADEQHMRSLVRPHCMDMADIPRSFTAIDLLWSEGAAYNIGFEHALSVWLPSMTPGGCVVVSELSWLQPDDAPRVAREFFSVGYPGMRTVAQNVECATRVGYTVLAMHVLPKAAWVDGYYDILAGRAQALLAHSTPAVREAAADMIQEIEVFEQSNYSYGYVCFVLQRPELRT